MHRLKSSKSIIVKFFLNFENLVANLSTFSHSNNFFAPVMHIFDIYSTGYSSIKANETVLPSFFLKKAYRKDYKYEMTISPLWHQMNSKM